MVRVTDVNTHRADPAVAAQWPAPGAAMTRWRRALVAGAAVEAAAGVLAACMANALGGGRDPETVFAACTVAVAAAHMVLVPGWIGAPRPSVPVRLLRRTILAVLTILGAICAALAVLSVYRIMPSSPSFRLPGALLYVLPFVAAGAAAGLGAMAAETWDRRPGIVQARWRAHVAGGVTGVLLVLALATLADMTNLAAQPDPRTWWPLMVLVPAVLVLGGGVHNALIARDAVRTGTELADPGPMAARTAACCAVCLVLAAVTSLVSA